MTELNIPGYTAYPNPTFNLPSIDIRLRLSEKKTLYERQAYTLMILIGDIGGFAGAIIGLPAYFLSWYSNKMFSASIYKQLPVKDSKKKQQHRRQYNSSSTNLQEKIAKG